ncbi:DegV family protein [Mesobacillus boroniphilus]|uniref:Uncharacterized protein n=1 Tax=Mesobacillus boroniphilus JCM 21738 TaxID=1294265 RepID=W4RPM7_9BACI|nr:hypothetical protein JCM21738_3165 [Mesobacillus boroniphilus JCM 21738]
MPPDDKCKSECVDSRFISKGLAFQVLEAARMATDGKSAEEIVARLDVIREHTR